MLGAYFSQMSRAALGIRIGLSILLLAGLAGCPSSGRVLDPLPPPVVQSYRYPTHQAPSPPPRPRPAPAPSKPRPAPPSSPAPPVSRAIKNAVVVLDPGHGGKDSGAWPKSLSNLPERTIVLDVANRMARDLSSRGAKVVRTRSSDVFIELDARAKMADRHRADLFVSIHADSAPRRSASGVGLHIHPQANAASQKAATHLERALRAAGIEVRGVFRNNFHVLREHSRPAVLVECGFLTNAGDARNLNNANHRAKLAAALADGITNHLTR